MCTNVELQFYFAESFFTLQVINIFNFFISYGDTFLKTTQMYDELYYELNREEKIFSELNAFGRLMFFFK
jgi:Domain of unknown function (DUF1741)